MKKNWWDEHIDKLRAGETTQVRPTGKSMRRIIAAGDLVTIEPVGDRVLKKDDVVLVRVGKNVYLHLILTIDYPYPTAPDPTHENADFQIGNNLGHINGWVEKKFIYGIVTNIQSSEC